MNRATTCDNPHEETEVAQAVRALADAVNVMGTDNSPSWACCSRR